MGVGGLCNVQVRDAVGRGGCGGRQLVSVSVWVPLRSNVSLWEMAVGGKVRREVRRAGITGMDGHSGVTLEGRWAAPQRPGSLRKVWYGHRQILQPDLAVRAALSPRMALAFLPPCSRLLAGGSSLGKCESQSPAAGTPGLCPPCSWGSASSWSPHWPGHHGPGPVPSLHDFRGKGQGEESP